MTARRSLDSNSLEKGSVQHVHRPPASKERRKVLAQEFHGFAGESDLPPPPELTTAEEKALYRKIDIRLMPILSLMYLCSFLDRGTSSDFSSLAAKLWPDDSC